MIILKSICWSVATLCSFCDSRSHIYKYTFSFLYCFLLFYFSLVVLFYFSSLSFLSCCFCFCLFVCFFWLCLCVWLFNKLCYIKNNLKLPFSNSNLKWMSLLTNLHIDLDLRCLWIFIFTIMFVHFLVLFNFKTFAFNNNMLCSNCRFSQKSWCPASCFCAFLFIVTHRSSIMC